jgi:hypothetical protein
MSNARRFPYRSIHHTSGEVLLRPRLPVTLSYRGNIQAAEGLLDTGADVNVLPYQIGIALGADWNAARTGIRLSGNLANFEARGQLLSVSVADFPSVTLAFAWTEAEHVPLIFGQTNFFAEFDVCFFQSRNVFEIAPKATSREEAS